MSTCLVSPATGKIGIYYYGPNGLSMRQKKQPAMPEPTDPEPLEPDPGVPPDFALLGLCYDRTQTLWKGAALAPAMLREAFPKLETFVHGIDLTESGLDDLGDIETTSEKEATVRIPLSVSVQGLD